MITLGVNAAFHDSAAALVADGRTIAAAEEERFTRVKHGKRPVPFTAWELPFHAIDFCLAQAGLTLAQVDHVAYSFQPSLFIGDRLPQDEAWEAARIPLPLDPAAQGPGDWDNPWDPLFAAYVLNAPRQLTDGAPLKLHKRLKLPDASAAPYRWHYVPHHLCHQASAFLAAPWEHCAVMTLDGRGERASTCYGRHAGQHYEPLGEVHVPHSLGLLYERLTAHLGFLHSSDEYKVMALAAMGMPRYRQRLHELVRVGQDGQFRIEPFDAAEVFGPPREPGAALQEHHLDLAASLQDVLEETVLELARWLRRVSGERYLGMAGGVALNCLMNSRLRDAGVFDEVWVQPAAGDAGTALGAALWVDARARRPSAAARVAVSPAERSAAAGEGQAPIPGAHRIALGPRTWHMSHAYLGPAFDDAEIEELLRWAKLRYRRLDDVAAETAALLQRDAIVGWFQGAMEFGPRALGARSILASPLQAAMQVRLNELKDREDFRPVAPVLPQELLADWFSPAQANGGQSPFMLFVYQALAHQRQRIPAACHVDGSARVQTVAQASMPLFHSLLCEFGKATGVPVLINTSFNVRGEPIVCTPRAALEAFHGTPLDALVIGSFLREKKEQRP